MLPKRAVGLAGIALAVAVGAACTDTTVSPTPAPSAPPKSTPAATKPSSPAASPTYGDRPGASRDTRLTPVVWHGPRDRKLVALTFDADLTAAMRKRLRTGRVRSYYNADLIATLRRLRVPATLFLTGMWMDQYPAETRALAADPLFELGTHSYAHKAFTGNCYTLGTLQPDQMLPDVRRAVAILDRLDPHATRWFRFPGGCYDGRALHALAPAGVTAVQFDVAGADGFAKSPAPIVRQVVDNVRPGSIVVLHLHGGDNAPYTDEALTPIVRTLRARGYTFVPLTTLLP